MRVLLLFICLFILPYITEGQDKKNISSSKFSKREDDTYSLINKAEKIADKDPKAALDYVGQALSQSLKDGDRHAEALSYQTLGKINFRQSLYSQSIEYYNKSIQIYQEEKNFTKVSEVKGLLGESYEANGNYEKAIENYNVALKNTKRNPDENISLRYKIARVYEKLGKNEDALKIYKDILAFEEERKNNDGIITANNKIGNIYLNQEKTQQARQYYEKSKDIAVKSEDTAKIAETYNMIGNTLRKEGKYQDEVEIRQQALEVKQNQNILNNENLIRDYLNIGLAYLDQKKASEALPYLEKSAVIAKELNMLEDLANSEKALSSVWKMKGNFKNALEHFQKYIEAKDSLIAQREKQISDLIVFNEELALKQKKIDLLEKDMKLNAQTILLLEEEKNFSQMMIYVLSGGLIIVFGSSWLIYNSSRKRRIANQKLALKSLRSQMNPHFIFNALNSVNNYISKNDERSANKYLSDFAKLMRTVMENSQYEFISLSTELSILELYLSLEHERFKEKFDYELNVSEDLFPEQIEIPPMLIQPYIENAVWHGLRYRDTKGMLKVSISMEGNTLKVIIEDNGIGRQKSMLLKTANQKANTSTGLKNTENRLNIINDLYKTRMQVNIEDLNPEENSGTRVTILITSSKKISL